METFTISTPYIELSQLLKVAGPFFSGGQAKHFIAQGLVLVDGEIELRKKCKIKPNQTVQFGQFCIKVVL